MGSLLEGEKGHGPLDAHDLEVVSVVEPRFTRPLSEREAEVIRLAGEGYTDKEICVRLELSLSTIRCYWIRIRQKCNAHNRCQAVAECVAGNGKGSCFDKSP